jgi:hypothetical protein
MGVIQADRWEYRTEILKFTPEEDLVSPNDNHNAALFSDLIICALALTSGVIGSTTTETLP